MTTDTQFPTFTEFFKAIHGFVPHAWQVELERSLRETGQWPWQVAVPTGLGKTSTIDIAVYELALQCHTGGPRTAPQRIFHVVDRRRIINSTAVHAKLLADGINDPKATELKIVHDALAQLRSAGTEPVIAVSSIHGERPDDRVWMQATGCSVISLTAHQYVSRLLLRGYGVSPGTRPIAAGLCCIDALVLFDEPHLSDQSVHTIRRVQQLQGRASENLGIPQLELVLLGATVPSSLGGLHDESRGSLTVSRNAETGGAAVKRLSARRTVFVHWIKPTDGEVKKALVAGAKEASKRDARRIVVFVNTVETAQAVYLSLVDQQKTDSSAIVLLTSHFRAHDRMWLDNKLNKGPCIVVTTQTLEVGVDLTFDELITEVAPWASLTQRLGRLNRDGTSNNHGQATVIAGWDDASAEPVVRKGSAAVYGEATVKAVTRLLRALDEQARDQGIDMGFDGLRAIAASDDFDVAALEGDPARVATLTSSHLPLLAQTRPAPDPDIPVDALISGPDAERAPEVSVAWRDELSVFDDPRAPRVDPSEYVTIPRYQFGAFLRSLHANLAGRSDTPDDREQIRIWAPQQERWVIPRTDLEALNTQQVILSSSLGGYDPDLGWTGSMKEVGGLDVSADALIRVLKTRARGFMSPSADLVLTRALWMRLSDDNDARSIQGIETEDLEGDLAMLGSSATEDEDDGDLEPLERAAQRLAERLAKHCDLDASSDRLQILQSSGRAVVVRFARDVTAKTSAKQELDVHQRQVAAWTDADAAAAGIPQWIANILMYAGLHHDDGKLRPEWQSYIGADAVPLARSGRHESSGKEAARRKASGLEDGWRHEADSVRRLGPCPTLLAHLVGAHHGWYRPILPPVRPAEEHGSDYPHTLNHADQFAELNSRFGVWGLAYLEAVLRLADWRGAAKTENCNPREVSMTDLVPDAIVSGGHSSRTNVHQLEGLRTHPLTGWYSAVGLLIAAQKKDSGATLHWEPFGDAAAAPIVPVLITKAPVEELVSQILHDPQWAQSQSLVKSNGFNGKGLGVKYQKLRPAVRLHGLLLEADDTELHLVTGMASDLGPANAGAVTMPIVPIANMSSYPEMALKMVTGKDRPSPVAVTDVCAALFSITEGFINEKCDGGMDRPDSTNPGVNGLGNPMIGQIRTVLAPLAIYGISLLGSGPVDGLGVTRSGELVLPLPTTPVTLSELRAAVHVGGARPTWAWGIDGLGWVYSAEQVKLTKYESTWTGRPRRRNASDA